MNYPVTYQPLPNPIPTFEQDPRPIMKRVYLLGTSPLHAFAAVAELQRRRCIALGDPLEPRYYRDEEPRSGSPSTGSTFPRLPCSQVWVNAQRMILRHLERFAWDTPPDRYYVEVYNTLPNLDRLRESTPESGHGVRSAVGGVTNIAIPVAREWHEPRPLRISHAKQRYQRIQGRILKRIFDPALNKLPADAVEDVALFWLYAMDQSRRFPCQDRGSVWQAAMLLIREQRFDGAYKMAGRALRETLKRGKPL
jgi:hypothetical protein